MSSLQEDTRALPPLKTQAPRQARRPQPRRPAPARRNGNGCLFQGVVGVVFVVLALLLVALAGWWGLQVGQEEAQAIIEVTLAAQLRDQVARIPADVAAGNTQMLARRLNYLASQTPAVAGLPRWRLTATALARPPATFTPTPGATITPSPTTVPPQTAQWQPDELLAEGRRAIGIGEYQEGVDLLQALEALEPEYEREAVRALILSGLTKLASRLYRSDGRLAEAILVTDEALRYGLPEDSSLRYERHVAALYLEARSMLARGPADAIPALRAVYDAAPDYRDGELRRLLGEQHAARAEQLLAEGDACAAQQQWQEALTLGADNALAQRRDEAGRQCQQGPDAPGGEAAPAQSSRDATPDADSNATASGG